MQTLSQQGFSPLGLVLKSMGHGMQTDPRDPADINADSGGFIGPCHTPSPLHLLLGKVACFDLSQA